MYATDSDNDTLIYTLSGTDAAAFSIVSSTGQLQTKTALNILKFTIASYTKSLLMYLMGMRRRDSKTGIRSV